MYNIPSRFRLRGKLNLAAFEQSLTEIIRRHEALRTCILTVDGRPVQKIASPEPFPISVVDLQGVPDEAGDMETARLALSRRAATLRSSQRAADASHPVETGSRGTGAVA